METAPSVPQWHSRPPGGSLRPQRPPRRLPPPELRSFAARRGSGWGGRDPMSVIRRTCSPSELSVASFVRDNAGSPQTRHSRQGPEAARDTGLGRGRAVLSPEACAPARSKAPAAGLGRCRAPAPPCFLARFHMSPPSRSSEAPWPVQTPHVWGEEGAAPGPRDNPPGVCPQATHSEGRMWWRSLLAGELRWRIPFPVYFDRKSERVFDQRKGDVIKGNRRMRNFLNHTKKYLFHYSKTSLTIQITC